MQLLSFRAGDGALFYFLAAALLDFPVIESWALGFSLADGMASVDALAISLIPLILIFGD
jgi:hypothetical protein